MQHSQKNILLVLGFIGLFCIPFSAAAWQQKFDLRGFDGQVVDADTGAPIKNAEVVAAWGLESLSFPSASFIGNVRIANATTDDEGKFSIPGSGIFDGPERDYRYQLTHESPNLRIYYEEYNPSIKSLYADVTSVGIPFVNRRVVIQVNKPVVIKLDRSPNIREELQSLSSAMSSSYFFQRGVCENQNLKNFVKRILQRQDELLPSIMIVQPNYKLSFFCDGKNYSYYNNYGASYCNPDHTECAKEPKGWSEWPVPLTPRRLPHDKLSPTP